MSDSLTAEQEQIRDAVREVCSGFPGEYWRKLDAVEGYPTEFVDTLTAGGWLAALIPSEYGGSGLGILEASLIMEGINASGGNAAACHAQMYIMDVLTRRGTEAQKKRFLPELAAGRLRMQAFGVTEPTTGSDTTQLQTPGREARGPLRRAWAEGVHFEDHAFGPDAVAGPYHASRPGQEENAGSLDPDGRP